MSGTRFTQSERKYVTRARRASKAAFLAAQEVSSSDRLFTPRQSRLEQQIRNLGR